MAWTLNLLLVLGSIVLLTYLHRAIQKLRKNAFVYPSEAVVDQLIPPEIMEQIVLNCDYETLMACSVVSKYWHYHAAKDHVQDHVFRNDISLAQSEELKEYLVDHFKMTESMSISWPDNYPPKYRVEDLHFAKQRNVKLIETNLRSARRISHLMKQDPAIAEYLVKLRCKLRYGWTNYWSMEDIASSHSFTIKEREVPDCQKYAYSEGLECDVILDLKAVWNDRGDFTEGIRRLRVFDNRPHIAGFPVSAVLLQLLIILIMPCLLVDYLDSAAHEVKFYAKVLMTLMFEFAAIFISISERLPFQDGTPGVTKKRRIGILSGIGIVLFGAVFYRWSLELALYVTLLAGCTFYYFVWETLVWTRYKYSKLVGAITVCMVILMNDWKLTVDAFKSGIILWTFLYNVMMHIQLAVIFAVHNAYSRYSYSSGTTNPTWKEYLTWRSEYKDMIAYGFLILVFVTLYAPTTTNKIF